MASASSGSRGASEERRARMQIGAVVGRGASVWAENALPFTTLALVACVPMIAYAWNVPWWDLREDTDARADGAFLAAFGGYLLAWLVSTLLLSGAISTAVIRSLSGSRPGFSGTFAGLVHVVPVLGLAVVFALIFVGLLLTMGVSYALMPALGVVVFLILGSMVACCYWVAVPAAVVERRGVLAALGSSRSLTRGNRLRIFLVIVVLFGATWLLSLLLDQISPFYRSGAAGIHVHLIAETVLAMVLFAFGSSLNAVAYHDLRTSRDGLSVEDISKVFD